MADSRQIEAGQNLKKDTRRVIKDLTEQQRQSIGAKFKAIGRKEVKRTKGRLIGRGGLSKMVGTSKAIESRFAQSRTDDSDLGTITFGTFGIVQGKGRWNYSTVTKEPIDIASIIATGSPESGVFGPVTATTDAQKKRGFVFGGNHPDNTGMKGNSIIRLNLKMKLGSPPPGVSRIPPVEDFLPKAQSNIIRDLQNEIPAAIREATSKVRDGPKRN